MYAIISNYDDYVKLGEYCTAHSAYTMKHARTAAADYKNNKYSSAYFENGGRLAAVAFMTASGSYTFCSHVKISDGIPDVTIRRSNPYIDIFTDDIGKFVYLVPFENTTGSEYTSAKITFANRGIESTVKTADASDVKALAVYGGYTDYMGKYFYTPFFAILCHSEAYDDASGSWLTADGNGDNYELAIDENRDSIPAFHVNDSFELYFPANVTQNGKMYITDMNLQNKKEISSPDDLKALPEGTYYLFTYVTVGGRTVGNQNEASSYLCVIMADVN